MRAHTPPHPCSCTVTEAQPSGNTQSVVTATQGADRFGMGPLAHGRETVASVAPLQTRDLGQGRM